MPKSNFNQFLDECEHFKTFENKTISKISFETNHHDDHECESVNQSQNQNQSATSNYNTSFSEKSSNAFSSNIFLSNNANRQGQNRFSTNRSSHNNNIYHNNHNENSRNARMEKNMFKKMDANQCTNQTAVQDFGVSPSSSTSHIVEINNETFPSLVPTPVSNTNNNTVPKKFKNFKDAICASAAEPALSPTKQKQLKAMAVKQSSVTRIPHPLDVKKGSEMYAKKILAKTKILAYGDDEDDGDDYYVDDSNEESLYKSHYKQTFIKKRYSDNDDSDD